MIPLADVARGRDNNFNLIRIAAASAVLVSHSYQVATGMPAAEPLRQSIGMTPGTIAVDIFFLTSGFLVTASILRKPHVAEFAWARFLRIFPALVVVMLASVFVLGPMVTVEPLAVYFSSWETYRYLLRGCTLFLGIEQHLPAVFDANPVSGVVNSSLWTMPYEVRMYAILALLWLISGLLRSKRMRAFKLCLIGSAAISTAVMIGTGAEVVDQGPFIHLFSFFFVGGAFYVLRGQIPVSGAAAVACVFAIAGSYAIGSKSFAITYVLLLGYVVIYAAYAPTHWLHAYNRLGDYSYGIYIFAWPIQQLIAYADPGASPHKIILFALPTTLICAVISWYLIEKRALTLKAIPPFGLANLQEKPAS